MLVVVRGMFGCSLLYWIEYCERVVGADVSVLPIRAIMLFLCGQGGAAAGSTARDDPMRRAPLDDGMCTIRSRVNLLVSIALVRPLVAGRDEAPQAARPSGSGRGHHPSSKAVPVLISRQHD